MNFLVFYGANLLASLRVLLIRCDSYQHNTSYVFITDFESYAHSVMRSSIATEALNSIRE